MIAICAAHGILRITVERGIPSALGGQWDLARVGKLTDLINDYIEDAELVDATAVSPRGRLEFGEPLLCQSDASTRE